MVKAVLLCPTAATSRPGAGPDIRIYSASRCRSRLAGGEQVVKATSESVGRGPAPRRGSGLRVPWKGTAPNP